MIRSDADTIDLAERFGRGYVVGIDARGEAYIACRHGRIVAWGEDMLAATVYDRQALGRLRLIPGCRPGDDPKVVLFAPGTFATVAAVVVPFRRLGV